MGLNNCHQIEVGIKLRAHKGGRDNFDGSGDWTRTSDATGMNRVL